MTLLIQRKVDPVEGALQVIRNTTHDRECVKNRGIPHTEVWG